MRRVGAWGADGTSERAHCAQDAGQSCCQCARQPAQTCRDCELAYCTRCSAKRHAKGAFRRHVTTPNAAGADRAIPYTGGGGDNNAKSDDATGDDEQQLPTECDECQRALAALHCASCELHLCAACSGLTHAMGSAARHEASGAFRRLPPTPRRAGLALYAETHEGQELARSSSSRSSLSSSQATLSPAGSPLYGSLHELETSGDGDLDNQKEPSPLPASARHRHALRLIEETPSAAAPMSSEAEGDAFDLWSGWHAHSFGSRSGSIDSAEAAPEWRHLRSLSIDKASPTTSDARSMSGEQLPVESLSNSLRALSVLQPELNGSPDSHDSKRGAAVDRRPRSFSDYSSLRSRTEDDGSPWSSHTTGYDAAQQLDMAVSPASPPRGMVEDLWKALKTHFATRHVLVKSADGHFDLADVRRISDIIHNFGSVARVRSELASQGLLFFTFRELRSAIGTVKTLSLEQSSLSSGVAFGSSRAWSPAETIHFSLPYELPDDVNSATVAVTLHPDGGGGDADDAPRVTPTAMRQFCSRFGEVASVMQTDAHTRHTFIVEFNDCRVVAAAVHALASLQLAVGSGPITAVRAASPTLDVSKIQRFQECVEQFSASMQRAAPSGKARPKSFSSSSTSILTSPTSSVASSLNASFLEAPVSSAASAPATSPGSGSPALTPAGSSDERVWARAIGGGRVRSISLHASASSLPLEADESALTDRFRAMSASIDHAPYSTPSIELTCATYPPVLRHGHGSRQPSDERYVASSSRVAALDESNQLTHSLALDAIAQQPRTRVDPCAAAFLPASSSFLSASKLTMSASGRVRDEQAPAQPYRQDTHPSCGLAYQQYGAAAAAPAGRPLPGQGRHDQGTGEFCLSIERVASGEDARTTLMVRNIPNKYTQQMLLAEINQRHRGQYDFFYLPIDFKNKCNMGYAFINFMRAASIVSFYREFDGQKWTNFNSEKVCAISYARLQGKQAMIARFQNSSLLDKHESYRPLVFVSSGPNRGQPEPFPSPKMPPTSATYRKHHHHHHHSPPPPVFSASPGYLHHFHHARQHHDELFAGGPAAYVGQQHAALQPLPYHMSQQQYYPPQPNVLVVDPQQAQAFLAAQMAAAAAIAPGRGNYRAVYQDARYQQQQQQQQRQRSTAYESFERRQAQGYGGRVRYSS